MASLWELSTDGGSTYTDLEDLYFIVESSTGTGMLPVKNLATPLALQPGSQYDSTAILDRPFALHGAFNTASDATKANFHSRKATLLRAFNANAGTEINARPAPIKLKYTGATADKVIDCYYEGGFEDSSPATDAFSQNPVTLRFVAFDPFFYATSESNTVLDRQDSATFTMVGAKISGLWDNLGPPNAAGTYTSITSIAEDDTYIYFGGSFSNFDNIAAADNLVRYNKSTETYSAVGSSGANSTIWALATLPNGDLVAGGDFTSIGGTSANRIAVWDGAAWSAYGTGATAIVYDIEIALNGNMYICGDFASVNGVSNTAKVAYYDGSSWNAMGTGLSGGTATAFVLKSDALNNIYVGGDYNSASGTAVESIAVWDGSAWSDLGTNSNTVIVRAIAIDADGLVYVGGQFSAMGSQSTACADIAVWNGVSWAALGSGTNTDVYTLAFYEGELYLAGSFTTAGGVTVDRLAIWNGSVYVRPDIDLPGSPIVRAFLPSASGLWIGFNTDGTAQYAGNATVAYAGTAMAYPYITLVMAADGNLVSLANATTGAQIHLTYAAQADETITLDARPTGDTPLTVTSSFYGNITNQAIAPNSDFGNFYLTPGRSGSSNNNVITLWVDGGTTATIYYTAQYLSQD